MKEYKIQNKNCSCMWHIVVEGGMVTKSYHRNKFMEGWGMTEVYNWVRRMKFHIELTFERVF